MLDETVRMKLNPEPDRILAFKMRLVKKLGYIVIQVSSDSTPTEQMESIKKRLDNISGMT